MRLTSDDIGRYEVANHLLVALKDGVETWRPLETYVVAGDQGGGVDMQSALYGCGSEYRAVSKRHAILLYLKDKMGDEHPREDRPFSGIYEVYVARDRSFTDPRKDYDPPYYADAGYFMLGLEELELALTSTDEGNQ